MYDFPDYTAMRQEIGLLYANGEHAKAAEILEWGLTQFPENLLANTYNLALFYANLQQPEKALATLQSGLDQGVWYGQWDFEFDFWQPVKALAGFGQIQAQCNAAQAEAQQRAKPELTVVPPKEYDPAQKYPLFIALHGGGETVAAFQPQWTSPGLESSFIVAYPQSSRVINMNGFSWMGDDQDRREIAAAYQSICAAYAVDAERVLSGGFSAGGHLSLTLLLDEEPVLPMRGFIALCPPVPDYSPEAIRRVRARGQRGVILTTEMDGRVEEQRKMAEALDEGGVPVQFTITPNIGHWYPVDLGKQIDRAIDFIFC
jgi:predicted esterase